MSNSYSNHKITQIKFEILSPNQIESFSHQKIAKKEIYDLNSKLPVHEGPLDPNLGSIKGTDQCQICNETSLCPGHFGSITLHFPVFHVGFFKHTYNILQCICKTCGSILVSNEKIKNKKNIKFLIEESRKISKCEKCESANSPIKRGPGFKLFHGESKVELSPLFVYNLFKLINPNDYSLLNIALDPVNLLIKNLPVPPSCIRPSVKMLNTSNEDDLTIKLAEIIHTNEVLKNGIEKGNPLSVIQEDWDFLQLQVSLFINSDLPNFNKADSNFNSTRQIRGVIQRLKGKHGRFRGNLSGKRVDFTGRTVISPDPNLSIEEVGIPLIIAKNLTIPERVTSFNMEKLKKCILNGPNNHPGANYHQSGFKKNYLLYADTKKIIENIKEGDIVERHLSNGDVVLFNRQPSLHRISIMCHKVRVHPFKTLRFNECVCTPYNADFDGDEMNIHVPQTIEARTEAQELMRVGVNLLTPRNGEPLVACTQDFITAMFLLTGKDTFFTKESLGLVLGSFLDDFTNIKIQPCIKRPYELFSGKQVFDLLIKDSIFREQNNSTVNLKSKNMSHKDKEQLIPDDDTLIVIKDNDYLFGRIDKSIVGTENKKGSLIYQLILISNRCAINAMNSMAKLASFFLSNFGFSIGMNDVKPSENLKNEKSKIVEKIYNECDDKISEFNKGLLQPLPGCSTLETLESSLSSLLSKIREDCGNLCIKELSNYNTPLIMQECGSKGSKINVAQMVACVGQQIISGKRISDAFVCNMQISTEDIDKKAIRNVRTLPHFHSLNSLSPLAKGFVCNSFFSGLTPTEFLFHAVSGREGLVDTAVKTAETGYMQRRLMKAMEDLKIDYDQTIRNAVNEIVQFNYNEILSLPPAYSLNEPGTAVGAIAGQSIGEPGTQMTLKTFHFAGVASMNITLGVPRLKEIINATKNISTPIIKAEIDKENQRFGCVIQTNQLNIYDPISDAYIIKGRIEKIYLKDICSSLNEIYNFNELALEIEINFIAINELKLELSLEDIKNSISKENKIPIEHISSKKNRIEVIIKKDYYIFKSMKRKILNTHVCGIKTISRCVVNEDKNGEYSLVLEGTGLKDVLGIQGIKTAISNNVLEIFEVLGIEAGRQSIINEVLYTMEKHGITIDKRHVDLLADTMTFKGEILGITRFGIGKMKMNTLMLASFEQTSDHLFNAAIKGKEDSILGVSESIIIGNKMKVGTGVVDLFYDEEKE